jgi:glycosyltransferase involved in cell wall biosynthesis
MSDAPRRFVAFTAFSDNLRARALIGVLRARGHDVREVAPPATWHPTLGLLASIVPNLWVALTCRADVAVGFKPHPNVTLPLLVCKLRGIPTWLDVDDRDGAYRRGWQGAFVEVLQRPFPRLATVVTYHHRALRRYLEVELGCAPQRLVRLLQGVDVACFGAARQLRRRDGVLTRDLVVYSGHLNRANDLGSVLRAWRSVVARVPSARLLVIGGGPRLRPLRRTARRLGLGDRVGFTGPVDHGAIPGLLARADIGVVYMPRQPFNDYRCSLKLREYLAAGMRVVGNDAGELHGSGSFVYQCGSSEPELADMLVKVLAGFDDERQDAGRRAVADHLDWGHVLDLAFPALAELLGLERAAITTMPDVGEADLARPDRARPEGVAAG